MAKQKCVGLQFSWTWRRTRSLMIGVVTRSRRNGIPDFLDEMQWELDWMLRMQENDPEHPLHGGVHYMVNTRDYEWMRADLDEAPRFLYEVSSVATADFAAANASTLATMFNSMGLSHVVAKYLALAKLRGMVSAIAGIIGTISKMVCAIDSSTIDLCLSLFPWAHREIIPS